MKLLTTEELVSIFPQSGSTKHFKFGRGKIVSDYTCELIAIHKALEEYLKLEEKEKS